MSKYCQLKVKKFIKRELWSIGQVPKGQEQANLQEMHKPKILSYFQASPIKIASHETHHAEE
jgi:hypothetical protein